MGLTITGLLVALVAVGCGSSTTPSTTKPTDTSTTQPSTTQPDTAVWPFAGGSTRYSDPVKAAKGFATEYLGFVDPVVGPFQRGDRRSGEVEIRPTGTGPVSTVVVRKLAPDETWWVLAASTPTLQLQSPRATASITSPVTLSGESTALEGTVSVEIREDGTLAPIATDFITGGANGAMGPFSKAIGFSQPTASGGAVILKTFGTENNILWEVSVVRVQFA
jgi:Immunoglobulin-like domain of bacterial spore germination.